MHVPNSSDTHRSVAVPAGAAQALTAITAAFAKGTSLVMIQVTGGSVRYTVNGSSTPTTSSGFLLNDGDVVDEMNIHEMNVAKFIIVSGSPVLEIAPYVAWS